MAKLGLRLAHLFTTDANSAQAAELLADFVQTGATYLDVTPPASEHIAPDQDQASYYATAASLIAGASGPLEVAATLDAATLTSAGASALDDLLAKLGLDHLSWLLVSGVNSDTWPELLSSGTLEAIVHSGAANKLALDYLDLPPLLDEILSQDSELFSAVQLHFDPIAWDDKGLRLRECYNHVWEHERQVIATSPFRGGWLVEPPEEVAKEFAAAGKPASPVYWSLRFASDEPQVAIVSVATANREHLAQDAEALAAAGPMSLAERNACMRAGKAARAIQEIPCIGCRRCVGGCPSQIPIPQLFALYNERCRHPEDEDVAVLYAAYMRKGAVASSCNDNRKCIPICPKAIQIPDMLAEVAASFEQ